MGDFMFNHCTLLQLLFLKNHELEDPNKSGFVSVNMSRYSSFSSDRREGNISATKTIGERRMSSKKKKKKPQKNKQTKRKYILKQISGLKKIN